MLSHAFHCFSSTYCPFTIFNARFELSGFLQQSLRQQTKMRLSLVSLCLLLPLVLSVSKTLSQNCYCDISSSCDQQCCCDGDCSSQATTYWSNYNLCANDGFAIPFCSAYVNTPLHIHDLSQGLRLIYTIIKRMFCISKVNFVTPSSTYQTTSVDTEIPAVAASVSAVNPYISSLTSIGAYAGLPGRDSLGQCVGGTIKEMNTVQRQRCRVQVATTGAIATNALLNPASFATTNGLTATSLRVFRMSSNSLTSSSMASATTLATCTTSGTSNLCQTIKQIKLFFIGTTIDYSSSYLLLASVYVNNPSYIEIEYSYQFMASATSFPLAGNQGYQMGSPVNLMLLDAATSTYTKMFNPINLGFRQYDGTCSTSGSNVADSSNLVQIEFGVNTVLSCQGTSSTLLSTNLMALFNYVGSFGISSTNLLDYIAVTQSTIAINQNVHLLVYYMPIGTELDPQYQIMQVLLQPSGTISTQLHLFIQFQVLSSSVFLNVPSPPTIDTSLPNDFLYPFYVA